MRTRLLRPGFFENEELAALPPHARLLFEGLWLMADRAGRIKDRPPVIRATLFPYEDIDVDALLADLARAGFIARYRGTRGEKCLEVVKFATHQHPHMREPESTISPPRISAKNRRKNEKPGLSPGSARAQPGLSPVDTDTDTDTYKIKPAAPRPVPFRVYQAIVSRVLDETADLGLDPATITEEIKREFAKAHIPYNATTVAKAYASVEHERAKRHA